MEKETTIQEVKDMCSRGAFRAFTRSGGIWLEDCKTGETVALREGAPKLERTKAASNADEGPYKGFLLIRCEECGAVEAYCAKKETYAFRCRRCRADTPLENLRPVYMRCKCGEEFRYKTNITDEQLTHICISCGAPVDMELNRRGTAYVTVGDRR